MIVLYATLAILAVVFLIIVLDVDPMISLVLGSLGLGLAGGLGFAGTLEAIVTGFGDIMAEVGLLIGFGVLIGALLFSMQALQRLVAGLLKLLGARRLPPAMAAVMTTLFPSIYVDVQLVLASPLARSAAPQIGARGLGLMGAAVTAGILVGYVFVVPGLGTVSIAGLLQIPLGTMLVYGLLVGPLTAVVTVLLYGLILRTGFWDPEKDEDPSESLLEAEALAERQAELHARQDGEGDGSGVRLPPLAVAMLPVLVPLVMIASVAIADAFGYTTTFLAFIGDPALALFVGLLGAFVLARSTLGRAGTNEALGKGFDTTGQILLITGVGGSLGAVIAATDLADVLGNLFSAEAGASAIVTILLAWLIAAVLHLAIGSISVAAIAASGIIGPVLSQVDVAPVIVGLAIGAGALFALHVNSNFFWMFQTLMGVSTRGALKSLTFVTSLASVVALPIIAALSLVA